MQLLRVCFTIAAATLFHAESLDASKKRAESPPDNAPYSQRGPPFGHAFEPLHNAPSTEDSRRGSSENPRPYREFRKNLRPRRQSLWEGPWEYIVGALVRPLNVFFMPGAIFGSLEAAGALPIDLSEDEARSSARLLASRGAPRGNPSFGHHLEPMEKAESRTGAGHNNSNLIEILIALAWIGCMALSPAWVRRLGNKPVTKDQQVFGGCMAVALLMCLFLFTQVFFFRSTRFDAARPLLPIECIYFMSQIITTVGYGDITPAEPLGKVFVSMATLGVVVTALLVVSDVASRTLAAARQYRNSLYAISDRALALEYDESHREHVGKTGIWAPPAPKANRLVNALAVFAFFVLTWALFFRLYPGENKPLAEATYMSIDTLSTVGLGAVVPETAAGRAFAAFWMPLGAVALVILVGAFAEYVVGRVEHERYSPLRASHALTAFKKESGGGGPSETDFMAFALEQRNLCDKERVEELRRAFKALNPHVRKGTIPLVKLKREFRILG